MRLPTHVLRALVLAGAIAPIAGASTTFAAPAVSERTGTIRVTVLPDREDWTYAVDEKAGFRVLVTRDGYPVSGASAHVTCGPEQVLPTLDETKPVPPDGLTVGPLSLNVPGFLRCAAEVKVVDRTYRAVGTAGFAPHLITPSSSSPEDFDAFWATAKKELAKLPIDAKLIKREARSNGLVDCYDVSLQNLPSAPAGPLGKGSPPSRFYGVLCEPKGPGPFPIALEVPGAGVRSYGGDVQLAEHGVITFQVGIHGIPVNLPDSVYEDLGKGPLVNYPTFNLDNRDRYYYRRVFMGVVRSVDFLVQHPRWNKKHLAITGGSQGGALSIIGAGLDPRIKTLVAFYPALSDHAGFVQGRAGGWPFLFRHETSRTEEKLRTATYFDVVNFARRIKIPGFYSFGYNDEVCPPTSMYAAYNVIGAPKRLVLALETGHATGTEQKEMSETYLLEAFGLLKTNNKKRITP